MAQGTLRAVSAAERAGLTVAIYLVAGLAFGVPVIAA
jgi:hypothetical protein